jgi:hypothetical protein
MLDTLELIESMIETQDNYMGTDMDGWQSMLIDYHKPFVERVWRQQGQFRVLIHRIHACTREEALLHPHPWPSAMRVINGSYEMGVTYGATGRDHRVNPVAAVIRGSSGMRYEMTDPKAWHYVRPLSDTVLTLMIAGKPFPGPQLSYRSVVASKVTAPLQALEDTVKRSVLNEAFELLR